MIDDGVGRIVSALERRGMLDDTWIVYTSDHGEMGGNHGLMSKCVLYQQAVRVPLIVRPPGGGAPRVVDDLVEHMDVPATVRDVAGAPAIPAGEGRTLRAHVDGTAAPAPRTLSVSENWGFASFETERYRLTIDEDACSPCQLFDIVDDPDEDHDLLADPAAKPVVDALMDEHVRPFLQTAPARPHPSPFTS